MAITIGAATTNFSSAGTQTPTVTVPSGAAVGDWLYSLLEYAGLTTIGSTPTGWTQVGSGTLADSGSFSLVERVMASGVTQAQWTMTASADGTYAKAQMLSVVAKGVNSHTLGTPVIRSGSSATVPVPFPTVNAGEYLVVFAGDRTSTAGAATAPTGMTEWAKYYNTGGGGGSVLAAYQAGPITAGTKTVTFASATTNAFGQYVILKPAAGNPPVISPALADATISLGATKTLSATVTGATSVAWSATAFPGGAAPTITNPTSATTASVTPTVAGTYTFKLSATNADGTTTDTMNLTVTSTASKPVSTVTNTANFSAVNASTVEAALSDGSDTTYIEAAAPSGTGIVELLSSIDVGTGYALTARMRSTATPTHTVILRLRQGTTVISSRTIPLTTTMTAYTLTPSSAELATITNRSDLRGEILTA